MIGLIFLEMCLELLLKLLIKLVFVVFGSVVLICMLGNFLVYCSVSIVIVDLDE